MNYLNLGQFGITSGLPVIRPELFIEYIGDDTLIENLRASSRIFEPVPSGVFRMTRDFVIGMCNSAHPVSLNSESGQLFGCARGCSP